VPGGAGVALPQPAEDDPDDPRFEPRIKIFALKNLKAIEAERIIRQLFNSSLESIASDERTNSLIVSGLRSWPRSSKEELFNVIFAILTRLDEPDTQRPQSPPPIQGESTAQLSGTITHSSASPAELSGKYERLDNEAKRLARQIR